MREILPGLWDIDEIGTMVHAYAWVWKQGITLIDTGMPGNADTILAALKSIGYGPSDVKRIIVTHADTDHMGSLRALKRATNAPVACHTVEKALLENPSRRQPSQSLAGRLLAPVYRLVSLLPAFRPVPTVPDELYVDGDKLPEGFILIHTPGHTPGHCSLLHPEQRFLIAGDALDHRSERIAAPPSIFTPDMENAHRSIWKLWKKYGADYDTIVFGHGEPVRGDATTQIKALVEQLFDEDVRP